MCARVCVFFLHLHDFLRRPRVFSHALGCGARRGPAFTQRRKFGPREGSVARALGVQSREIGQVITGVLSAELEPSKTIENPHVSHCCKEQQHGNSNRFKLASVIQLRTLLRVCGPLLCMRGHDLCVYGLCVCSVYVCARVWVCHSVVACWEGHVRVSFSYICLNGAYISVDG